MNKVMKLVSVLVMVVMMATVFSTVCMAIAPGNVTADTSVGQGDILPIGQKILGIIRNIAAVLLVVLIAVLGLKFMMGSTEEKAEYKKSFMPLIIGTVIVLLATSIGGFIWSTFSNGVN